MPKFRQTPLTADDLERYLQTDDDFAFELRCLHALRQRNVAASHGGTYGDPVTKKPRQFDLRARIKANALLTVSLAIECKNLSPAVPLLVSRVPRVSAEAFHELLFPKPHEQETGFVSSIRMDWTETVRVRQNSLYGNGSHVGKSIARVGVPLNAADEFISDDAEVYDRWAQSVASAYDLVSEANDYFMEDDAEPKGFWVLPILVVPDGTLWAVDYDSTGAIASKPRQMQQVEYYLDHSVWRTGQMFSYQISHLHIVTVEGLLSFVDDLRRESTGLQQQVLPRHLISRLVET